ncbi:RHS domain-containing protein [Chitinibacter fontanus]|uniref:RHS domain-containing protein n=1 Tax=Chitinibacter fontanus TaxID=1737446 RepID=A0A7D5V9D0_9NEIS|nr:RHS repeat-associated core domain-containing protein [Chitinibacter fontanus]QLI81214.1 RHS domain-containing protein [Chitinibacter fontanus]
MKNNKIIFSLYSLVLSALSLSSLSHAAPTPVEQPPAPVVVADSYSEDGVKQTARSSNAEIDSIDILKGSVRLSIPLFSIPGAGANLQIAWSWNSAISQTDTVHSIRVRATAGTSPVHPGTFVLELPDGQNLNFYAAKDSAGGGTYRTTTNWVLDGENGLYGKPITRWLKSPDGTVYTLDKLDENGFSYHLPSVSTDANGNQITYTYDKRYLTKMVASDGREINITWDKVRGRPTAVSAGGRTWSFNYINEKLADYDATLLAGTMQLNQPNGDAWLLDWVSYEEFMLKQPWDPRTARKPSSPLFTAVQFPTGGRINYQFNQFRVDPADCPYNCVADYEKYYREQSRAVLARKTTSDGGVWTYNHYFDNAVDNKIVVQAKWNLPKDPGNAGVFSGERTVSGPAGVQKYKFFSPYGLVNCQQDMWQVGLMLESSVANLETTTYSWAPSATGRSWEKLNDTCNSNSVPMPVMTGKAVVRDGKSFTTNYSNFDSYNRAGTISEVGDSGHTKVTQQAYLTDTSRWLMDKISTQTTHSVLGGPALSTLSRVYNANGNLVSENQDGITTSYSYFPNGYIASTTDARGFTTQFNDYYRGKSRTVIKPVGTGQEPAICPAQPNITLSRVIDDFGNVVSFTDGRRNTTSYQYDTLNRLTQVTPPRGDQTLISWSKNGRTVQRGRYTDSQIWDGFGRTIKSTINTVYINRNYDAAGRLIFESYPSQVDGDTSTYDALNRLTQISHGDGTNRSFGYSGSAVAERNERGFTTSYFYQTFGNPDQKSVIKVVPPVAGTGTDIVRDTLGKVLSVTQNGVTRNWTYDSRHFLVSRTDPEIGTTTYARDNAGNITSTKVGAQEAVSTSYDAQNRATYTSYANGGAEAVCRVYDANGNLTTLNNTAIKRTHDYDANDNLVRETMVASGNTLTLNREYNGNDVQSAIIYPNNQRLELAPDEFGTPTKLGTYAPNLVFNARNQLMDWQAANGRWDKTGYNMRGWPETHQVISSNIQNRPKPQPPAPVSPPGAQPVPPVQPGPPGSVEPNDVSADLGCRAAYPPPTGTSAGADQARALWTVNTYNPCVANWNAKGSEWSSGNGACLYKVPKPTCNHGHCNEDRYYQSLLQAWPAKYSACVSDWNGRAVAWNNYRAAYANWVAQQQNYQQQLANYNASAQAYAQYQTNLANYNQALAEYNAAVANDLPILNSTLSYDGTGNLLSITDTISADYNRSYAYDGIDRLITANAPNQWGTGTIAYDGNSNITRQQFGSWFIDYGYAANQRLASVTGGKNYSLSYDGWGNLTSRGDGQTYQFDAAGNLRWANKGAANQIAYTYDGAGTRVLSIGNGQNKLEFTALDGLLYYEKDLNTGASVNHLYLGRQKLVDVESNGTATYFHNDPTGSPLAATNATGGVIWRANYKPFGDKAFGAGAQTPIKNQQWFTGKPHEEATGLSYFGARWYDPVLGRFTAIDPVDWNEADPTNSFNRYAYANNNPFKFTDPDGRNAQLLLRGSYVVGYEVATYLGAGAFGAWLGGKLYDAIHSNRDPDTTTPVGTRGSPMDVTDGTNSPTTIGGRDYSGHSQDRMQGRGVPPSVVDNTIKNGTARPSRGGTTVYTDSKNGVEVVVNSDGKVITVKHVGKNKKENSNKNDDSGENKESGNGKGESNNAEKK